MRKLTSLFIVLVLLLVPTLGYAASPWMDKTTYQDKVMGKLDFGFKNLLLGWTELFSEPHQYHMDKKNVFEGIGKGLLNGTLDTLGGALHLLTAPIQQIDVPLPDNGVHFDK